MKLELNQVSFAYRKSEELFCHVNQVFLSGRVYAIIGKSGVGKTTLLSLLGGLAKPTEGKIYFNEKSLDALGLTKYRNYYVGYVYQQYNLLEYYSVYQNIEEALDICKKEVDKSGERIEGLLESLEISKELWNKNVKMLSGGEQQRVAIARALVKDPDIILADEPTGNLDDDTSSQIQKVLDKVAHEYQKCVILVTHSKTLAEKADIILRLKGKDLEEI